MVRKLENFINKFDELEFDSSAYVYCSMLFKKVISKRKSSATNDTSFIVFTTCLFISLKYILDDTLVILKDFAEFIGMKPKVLEQVEIGLLVNILDFKIVFTEEEYLTEIQSIKAMTSRMC